GRATTPPPREQSEWGGARGGAERSERNPPARIAHSLFRLPEADDHMRTRRNGVGQSTPAEKLPFPARRAAVTIRAEKPFSGALELPHAISPPIPDHGADGNRHVRGTVYGQRAQRLLFGSAD